MPRTKVPSSSKSEDIPRTPRQYKPRGSRSVTSLNSNTPGRLTTLIDFEGKMDSFALSPVPSRLSVLSDNTDIQEPRRRSWWRKLDEDCRQVMEVLETNKNVELDHVLEELDIEVLSQQQKSYNLELPECSGRESIASIVVPQKQLFTQKENQLPNKLVELINSRETMSDKQKNTKFIDVELPENSDSESISSIVIPQRQLFTEKENNPLNKLNELISSRESMDKQKKVISNEEANINKSYLQSKNLTNNKISDVVKETEIPKRQGNTLFGHHKVVKRKNLYTEFLTEHENLSANRTAVVNYKEIVPAKNTVKKIFGNRSGTKRVFAAFIGSEYENLSADEIVVNKNNKSEAKQNHIRNIFGNNIEKKRSTMYGEFVTSISDLGLAESQSKAIREPSPTSSCATDIEMDEWNQLPSSTMMEHQLLDEEQTPFKKSKLSQIPQLDINNVNTTLSKRKMSKSPLKLSSDLVKEDVQTINVSQNTRSKTKKSFIQIEDNLPKIIKNNESINTLSTKNDNIINSTVAITNHYGRLQNTSKQSNNVTTSENDSKNKSNLQELPNKSAQKNNITATDNLKCIKTSLESNQEILLNNKDIDELQNEQEVEEAIQNSGHIEESHEVRVENGEEINVSKEVLSSTESVQEEFHKNNVDSTKKQVPGDLENNSITRYADISQKNEIKEGHPKNSIVNEINASKKEIVNQELENDDHLQNENKIITINEMDYQDTESNQDANKSKRIYEELHESIRNKSKLGETNNGNLIHENNVYVVDEENENIEHLKENASDDNDRIESTADEDNKEYVDGNNDENEIALNDNNLENDSDIDENGDNNDTTTEDNNVDDNNESSVEDNDIEDDCSVSNDGDENEIGTDGNIENESVLGNNDDTNESGIEDNDIENYSYVDNNADENETGVEDNLDNESVVNDDDENESNVAEENVINNSDVDEVNVSAIDNNDDRDESDVNDNNESNESAVNDSADEIHTDNERGVNIPESDEDNESEEQIDRETSMQQDSPETILRVNSKQDFSFTSRRNTLHATKSIINDLNIKKSLLPLRESTRVSDGITDSSTEGSGWDSHRTTRKTLRQTFGRDFTPRKSLRALVMEKSAKRHTVVTNLNISDRHSNTTVEEPQHKTSFNFEDNQDISDHEESMQMKQNALEIQFNKHVEELKERLFKLGEEGKSSLNKIKRVPYDPFKLPLKPDFSTREQKVTKKKIKRQYNYVIPDEMLPSEFLKDLKYKPPKRFQPRNVGWTTKRLYRFLESKLEPYFDYRARVRAERVVRDIYDFVMSIRKVQVAPPDAINSLKREMARLDIVRTHYEFYTFFREYMPKEVRFKVIPNLINKLPLPRDLHADIIQDLR